MKKLVYIFLMALCFQIKAQTQLFVPDTIAGPNYNLTMHQDSVQFFPTGKKSYTYGFNQYKYLNGAIVTENRLSYKIITPRMKDKNENDEKFKIIKLN